MVLMAAAVSSTISDRAAVPVKPPRRSLAPDVSSRHVAASSSCSSTSASVKRCASPLASRTNLYTPSSPGRSGSAGRKRDTGSPLTRARGDAAAPIAQRMLFTSAKRIPVAFQTESFSLPVAKTKPAPASRRGTPERRKTKTSEILASDSETASCVSTSIPSPKLVLTPKKCELIGGSPATPYSVSRRKLNSPEPRIASRGTSPARARNKVMERTNKPSILSFAADMKRERIGEDLIADAHLLRLLHNKLLQWRFANARGDALLFHQTTNSETNLYNGWAAISRLQDSVRAKRTQLQFLKQHLKLTSILKNQMNYLEEWGKLEKDHSESLSGSIEALESSTLRLPVIHGAVANTQSIQTAICSALDMFQAMASSVSLLSSKVEDASSMATELIHVSGKERNMIDLCKKLLTTIGSLHVKECSLRTHISQQLNLQRNQPKIIL